MNDVFLAIKFIFLAIFSFQKIKLSSLVIFCLALQLVVKYKKYHEVEEAEERDGVIHAKYVFDANENKLNGYMRLQKEDEMWKIGLDSPAEALE